MKHELPFQIRVYECGPDGRILLSTLVNFMQEVAASHTVELHITIPELLPKGYTWMLSRYHIAIDKYPQYGDRVIMTSWVAEHQGLFSIRDFQLLDESGNSLARMTSSWVLYDIHKKESVRVDEVLPLDCVVNERAIDDPFHRLPPMEKTDHEALFRVRKHDLDINDHVNNRVIVEWALESVPSEISSSSFLSDLEIVFKGQIFYGQSVRSACQVTMTQEQSVCFHHITNSDNGKSMAQLRTTWVNNIKLRDRNPDLL